MKQRAVKLSIRWKLLVTMIGLTVFVLLSSTILQISKQKALYDRELSLLTNLTKEKLASRGTIISANLVREVQNGLATVNLSKISEVLKKTVDEDKELSYVILTDTTGRAYIHTLKPDNELKVLSGSADVFAVNQQQSMNYEHNEYGIPVKEFIVPVQISTQRWGTLRLGFSLEFLNTEIQQFKQDYTVRINSMILNSVVVAIIFIAISCVVILILSDRLSRPLSRLTRVANKLASGDFSAADELNDRSKDEIGVLSATFKDMAYELKFSYDQLQNYNMKLEQMVQERTAELADARDQAIRANRAKSDFLSMVSHEVRTPLNAIIGLTQLALKTNLNELQCDYLSKVKSASDSLLFMINDLLDMSKIEAEKLEIEEIDFNLSTVLEDVESIAGLKAVESNLELQFAVDENVPRLLLGDPFRLRQILLNLISNAIKFTESGSVIVRVTLDECIKANKEIIRLRFSVKDTGIGLTSHQIEKLFKPFKQADKSISRLYGGTGLGLTICKKLVELMGGEITVDSEYGVGSNFIFTVSVLRSSGESLLPYEKQDVVEVVSKQQNNEKRRILIVDDYELNLFVAKGLLQSEGFDVVVANSGKDALERLSEAEFDAVLMDLHMPEMDGYEATQIIKSKPEFATLPVIAVTADVGFEEVEKARRSGMDGYISKPISVEQLLGVLAELFQRNQSAQRPENKPMLTRQVAGEPKSGLDYQLGINLVCGDERVYHKLLFEFEKQFRDVVGGVKELALSSNRKQALDLLHALKGVASNIAAEDLAEKAQQLGYDIKNSGEGLPDSFFQFEQAMRAVLSDINEFLKKQKDQDEVQIGPVNYNQAHKSLNYLIELIKENLLDADLYLEDLKKNLSSPEYQTELKELEQNISQFEFDEALYLALKIKDNLPDATDEEIRPSKVAYVKPCVLIVDDISLNINVLVQALRKEYLIKVAKNAEKAKSIIFKTPDLDLVLLDIEMPGMNGFDLCRQLKQNVATEKIPVIFISGRSGEMDEKVGLEIGAVDYITRPFKPSVVSARVKTHVALKRQSDLLTQLVREDGLTGIANRRCFDEHLELEWYRNRRAKTPLSIIFIDVDFFKHFNDFFGHSTGDQCLCIVATTIQSCLKRQSDFVARYGGEEFVVILPDTDAKLALQLAEVIRSSVEALRLPNTPIEGVTSVTLSLGVSTVIPSRQKDGSMLVDAADWALYQAKCYGRNQIKVKSLTDSEVTS